MGSGLGSFQSSNLSSDNALMDLYLFKNETEENDVVKQIIRIKVPLSDNAGVHFIQKAVLITGNSPNHEGLIIITKLNKIYVAQVYPITFIQVDSYEKGIDEIKNFCPTNKNSKKYKIKDIWEPTEKITLISLKNFIKKLPNKYDILRENCQNFCKNIISGFPFMKIIEKKDDSQITYYDSTYI
jgi:hypothetical protein